MHPTAGLFSGLAPTHLLATFGVVGVFVILLIEMGLLVGFFLPGDSLLFIAGYATDGNNTLHLHLSLPWLLVAAAAGAIIGGQVGYEFGKRTGEELLTRRSRYYKAEYVERTRNFLDRFGSGKAVALSRFVPVVRTFVSPIVGVAGMPRASYSAWNAVSGVVWTVPILLLGHRLGHISFLRKYVEVIAAVAVVAAIVPAVFHIWRTRRA